MSKGTAYNIKLLRIALRKIKKMFKQSREEFETELIAHIGGTR